MNIINSFKKIIIIKKHMSEQRIDNFLFKTFKKLPKSMIYRSLRIGKIKINKKKVHPYYKLKINDNITFFSINIETKKKKINLSKSIIQLFIKNILFEDNDLIIFNKPYGFAVHGGSGISYGVIEIFRKIRSDLKFLELVHRIDKETSGILILSKKRSILKKMHINLREKKIYKEYLAILHGYWSKKNKIVKLPLLKKKNIKQKKKVCVHKEGKLAQTNFEIKKYLNNKTLVKIIPITGRTHQIRVHTAQFGHPIVFDNRYGKIEKKKKKIIKKNSRLLLHAFKVSFLHPRNNENFSITAPLDKKFQNCLKYFSKNIF
ncbi:RluA family pseudouridine synthase [Buchnera aphidicola]|uniref:Pseudouridine synthase n=1 Tax=Buchnera aphidicola subsp. Cinara cedri (strain Cc) TaxID=372461 RepID=Q057L6_BUCCC|nr:RluA family pseudouridine synthase [Buchnera aphidicola]ABJ90683.1 ribosomal large subunit pseudouridine synthase C [Buchnera aphidicola BCc]